MSNDEFNQGEDRISEIHSENEKIPVVGPAQSMRGFFNETHLV
jgi:hypothetical protein